MRTAFFGAYDEADCEYVPLNGPEIDKRLQERAGARLGQLRHSLSAGLPDHGAGPGADAGDRSTSCASSM